MGYDCTLHSVDEKLISKDFVKALLNGTVPTKGPVADAKLDEAFWKSVFEGFEKEKPSGVASLVCQLALVFASKSLPYHYERGFAISLWPELSEGLATEFPDELTESPEVLFKDLVEARPELKGSFPNDFDGNWTTGRFIPAKKIPKALAWVEKRVQKYDEGDRDLFRGLILVLKHCAKHKLAYWEATDLPVPMATIEAEGSDERKKARCFEWPTCGPDTFAQRADVVLAQLGRVGGVDAYLVAADFSVWPPKISKLKQGYPIGAEIIKTGEIVSVISRPGTYYYEVCRMNISNQSGTEPMVLSTDSTIGENGFEWASLLGDEVVALANFGWKVTKRRFPLFQNGSSLEPNKLFKAPADEHGKDPREEFVRKGVVRTEDGRSIFVWRDEGFVRVDGRLVRTIELAHDNGYGKFFSVPCGNDGFYYLSNRMLFESHCRQPPISHLPKLANVNELRAGPDNSLLLVLGLNKAAELAKLYWPSTRETLSIKKAMLPDVPKDEFRTLYWINAIKAFVTFTWKEVWLIPWADLKDLPRSQVRD